MVRPHPSGRITTASPRVRRCCRYWWTVCIPLCWLTLTSILHCKPRAWINANGAELLSREAEFITWHSALTLSPLLPPSSLSPPCSAALTALNSVLHLLTHPKLYRASLPNSPHPPSTATVVPLPAVPEGDPGVKLPGHSVVEWKDWLALLSSKYQKEWIAGVKGLTDSGIKRVSKGRGVTGYGCGWWRSNVVGVEP